MWDGSPFIPFGIVLQPKTLSGSTDFAADKVAVESLKGAGVTDVLIRSGGSISQVSVEAFQRIVDLLESNGMTYGVELNDAPYTPVTGYVVDTAVNREEGIHESGDVSHSFPDADSAIWVICDPSDHEVSQVGKTPVADGTVTVNVSAKPGREKLVLFYPHRPISSDNR